MVLTTNRDNNSDDATVFTKPEDISMISAPHSNHEQPFQNDGQTRNSEVEQEIVLVQEDTFCIQIHAPGLEPFNLPVNSIELVQEIRHVLLDKEETCHRTCFSLRFNNEIMDHFAELKTINGLCDGCSIKVQEEPYNVREARIHVRHVRDLLKSISNTDAYFGLNGMSLSCLNSITNGDLMENKSFKSDIIGSKPNDFVLPSTKNRQLLPLHSLLMAGSKSTNRCLKVLTYNGWNPPPGNRLLHGDLIYIMIVTLEDKKVHVTGSTRGFYLNQSTDDVFNPKPAVSNFLNHSLIDLLNQISPMFKKFFSDLLKIRSKKHLFERLPTPYQVHTWLAPLQEHTVDSIRAEDSFSAKTGHEENIPGQSRDWNEELQSTRELPRESLTERLVRERAIFKIHSDFVATATRAAVAVVDGNIMAINPGENSKMQMFIWNNLFFSLGFDVKDHYADFGGDAAAYVAPSNDLQGIKAYSGVDVEGLYLLGTVVVDYRGYRVTAQSIIPGILEKEQQQSVVYGSTDFGVNIVTNDKYRQLLQKTSNALRIRPHKVIDKLGEEVLIMSSVECKGIVGNDGRHYILDLLRTFPPDLNFLPVDDEKPCKEVRDLGFPVEHRHKLACLRQELIDAFIEARYLDFVHKVASQLRKIQQKSEVKGDLNPTNLLNLHDMNVTQSESESESEIDNAASEKITSNDMLKNTVKYNDISGLEKNFEKAKTKNMVESINQECKDIVSNDLQKVVHDLCNRCDTAFDLAFNPDVYQPHVKHADPDGVTIKKDKQLARDAADFLLLHQLPQLLQECREHTITPIDGESLSEIFHQRGINIRYLGKFTEMVAKYPNLLFLHGIATLELISRAAKRLFQVYLHNLEPANLSVAISHFLNCYLGSCTDAAVNLQVDDLSKSSKKKSKKKVRVILGLTQELTEWASETPQCLWRKIVQEVASYYHYKIECDTLDSLTDEFETSKVVLLRSFSRRCGIQLLLKDYNLYSRTHQPFAEGDVIGLFPVVKHIHPKASDAYNFFTSGQTKIQQGSLRDGHELVSEALNLLNNVYGPIHADIAACNKLLARLNYILGEHAEAMSFQQRAVLINERLFGLDHPNNIIEYTHLALYCFANGLVENSLRLLYRARYVALLCCSENHPDIALIDCNIGLLLYGIEDFDNSLRFLRKALQLNIKVFGRTNLKVAMNYHLVARGYSCRGDFRTALLDEKQAYLIYHEILGADHERTKESAECLNHLTQQAVRLQKKMNDLAKGETKTEFPPIQVKTSTLNSVLDTLNIINGIFFVQLSPVEIERLRTQVLA